MDFAKRSAAEVAVCRVVGAKHVRQGRPCQDASGYTRTDELVLVALADGHGSSRYSDVGAKLAVSVTLRALSRFAEEVELAGRSVAGIRDLAIHHLRVQLGREWVERVREAAGNGDVALVDYGSTLLFALAAPEYVLLGQLGDGDMLSVAADGAVSCPISPDERNFADETSSLCQRDAGLSMRIRLLPTPDPGTLLILSTDGYSNSYPDDASFRAIGPDYLRLIGEEGLRGVAGHLETFLTEVTTAGSGDDIAMAMIYWPDDPGAQHPATAPEAVSEQAEIGAIQSSDEAPTISEETPVTGEGATT